MRTIEYLRAIKVVEVIGAVVAVVAVIVLSQMFGNTPHAAASDTMTFAPPASTCPPDANQWLDYQRSNGFRWTPNPDTEFRIPDANPLHQPTEEVAQAI